MRILVLIDSFNASGGIQQSHLSLAKAMLGDSYEFAFAPIRAKGKLLKNAENLTSVFDLKNPVGSKIETILSRIFSFFVYLRCFGFSRHFMGGKVICSRLQGYEQVIRSYDPDVVLSTNLTCTMLALAGQKVTGRRCKILCAEHVNMRGLISSKYKSASKIRWATECQRRVFQEVDGIITVSKGVADDVVGYFKADREKVSVIYNGADVEMLRKASEGEIEDEWFLENTLPMVVSVGRISEQKNFDTLLEAIALVNEERPCRLAIIGGAEKKKHRMILNRLMQRTVDLGIEDNVKFLGFRRAPARYIAKADLFVLSSIYEGFGLVLLEALACGCPIVASDCPSGPSELLGHGEFGGLVSPRNPRAMADAIIASFDAPVDKNALRKRAEAFSIDRCVAKYRQALDQVMAT